MQRPTEPYDPLGKFVANVIASFQRVTQKARSVAAELWQGLDCSASDKTTWAKNRIPTSKELLVALQETSRTRKSKDPVIDDLSYKMYITSAAVGVFSIGIQFVMMLFLLRSFFRRIGHAMEAGKTEFTPTASRAYGSVLVETGIVILAAFQIMTTSLHWRFVAFFAVITVCILHDILYGEWRRDPEAFVESMVRVVLPLWITQPLRGGIRAPTYLFVTPYRSLIVTQDQMSVIFRADLIEVAEKMQNHFKGDAFEVSKIEIHHDKEKNNYYLSIAAAPSDAGKSPTEQNNVTSAVLKGVAEAAVLPDCASKNAVHQNVLGREPNDIPMHQDLAMPPGGTATQADLYLSSRTESQQSSTSAHAEATPVRQKLCHCAECELIRASAYSKA
jgi:hypothetical protein